MLARAMTDASKLPPIPKVALVTGAAKRIGRMIALALAKDGYAVGIHYHSSAKDADATVDEIGRLGSKGIALKADLAKEAEVRTLIPRVTEALGPLGVLVNNASLFDRDEAATVTRDSWDAHMEANLRAPFVLIQGLAAQLPAGAEGVVVNMLDERVLSLTPHFVSYTLSKAGLWTLTQTMALALAPRVRVVGIGPGPTMPSPRQSAAQFARQAASMPLKRGADPSEVAEAVRFILAARSMTGSILMLDGGQHLAWSTANRDTLE
jgi:NAD(P)-dependent dehydrogenase (short-subunit alcohol dehydrogenase family)